MKTIFLNHFNNGDLHISRSFVREIMKKFPERSHIFSHRCNPFILNDLNLNTDSELLNSIEIESGFSKQENAIYCNTWYAANHRKYISEYGISFDCLYVLYDEFLRESFGIELRDVSSDPKVFFPFIDFKKFNIENVFKWTENEKRKKILIVNAHAKSGQSDNFIMCNLFPKIAKDNPDCIFIFTNDEYDEYGNLYKIKDVENVIYTSEITKLDFDLNEIAYLSTKCDLILGRATGAFTFSFIRDNLFDRKIRILCFSNLIPEIEGKFWLSKKFQNEIEYFSNIQVTNETDAIQLELKIRSEIEKI